MKKGYKIGLFFICIILIILLLLLLWNRHFVEKDPLDFMDDPEQSQQSEEMDNDLGISQTQNLPVRTTCDTVCIYENIDKKDGSITFEEVRLPGKYINLTREELEAALKDDSNVLSLEDKEKCFQSQHLELFSQDKIKVVRIYDSTPEPKGYYIMAVDHEVSIYKSDKKTLYFKTDIKLEDLPGKVQQEVIDGKYMESEVQIYHFLESYSS